MIEVRTMSRDVKQTFSIRKLTIGAASVLISTSFLAQANVVKADETAKSTEPQVSEKAAPQKDLVETKSESKDLGNGFTETTKTTTKTENGEKKPIAHDTKRVKDTTVAPGKEVVKQEGKDGYKQSITKTTTEQKFIDGKVQVAHLHIEHGKDVPSGQSSDIAMEMTGQVAEQNAKGEMSYKDGYLHFSRDKFVDPTTKQTVYTKWVEDYIILPDKKTEVAGSAEQAKQNLEKAIADVKKSYEKTATISGMNIKTQVVVADGDDLKSAILSNLPEGATVSVKDGQETDGISVADIEIVLPANVSKKTSEFSFDPVDEIIAYNDDKPAPTEDPKNDPTDNPTDPDKKLDERPSDPTPEPTDVVPDTPTEIPAETVKPLPEKVEEHEDESKTSSENVRPHAATVSDHKTTNELKPAVNKVAKKNNAKAAPVKMTMTHKASERKDAATKATLPQTGESQNKLALIGLAVATAAGLFGIAASRKRKN